MNGKLNQNQIILHITFEMYLFLFKTSLKLIQKITHTPKTALLNASTRTQHTLSLAHSHRWQLPTNTIVTNVKRQLIDVSGTKPQVTSYCGVRRATRRSQEELKVNQQVKNVGRRQKNGIETRKDVKNLSQVTLENLSAVKRLPTLVPHIFVWVFVNACRCVCVFVQNLPTIR